MTKKLNLRSFPLLWRGLGRGLLDFLGFLNYNILHTTPNKPMYVYTRHKMH